MGMSSLMQQELTDIIIDHLHDNRPALGRCGLVCQSWLPSSRFHLFSTIKLFNFNIDTALTILCAHNSTIPPYVRRLEMEDGMGRKWDPPWVSSALLKLPLFTAIEELSLSRISWDSMAFEAKDRLLAISRGLKTLILNYMEFETLDQPLGLIASAPSLKYLLLGSMHCNSETASLTEFTTPPVKEIIFEGLITPVFIDWICLQSVPMVRRLSFRLITSKNILSISTYLRVLGPVLEHLALPSNSSEVQEIDLTHSTSLRTISFMGVVLYTHSPAYNYDWIFDVLSRIPSRFIERVTLVVYLNTPEEINALNLPALATLFAGGNTTFRERLTRLRVTIFGKVDRSEAQVAIAGNLRDLDAQGRLDFGRQPDWQFMT